ncbi:MAG: GPR1/FUN34/YaaH family transporter [Actinomycetes bacterium]
MTVPVARTGETTAAAAPAEVAAAPPVVGSPAVVGVPMFVVGAVALGLALTGYVPATATGAAIPIIMTATGLGLVIAAVWAASLSQNAVASIFAIFAGFWLSYAALVLGLTHNWFGIRAADAAKSQELFLLSWLLVIGLLTVASLRLPLAFTVLFGLITVALLLLLLGTVNTNTNLTKAGGYVVLAFALLGAYLFLDAMWTATGGRALPTGAPIVR